MNALLAVAAVCLVQPAPPDTPAAWTRVTAMTFNVRFATANDGDNSWARRREVAMDAIARADADVIGLQEALASQIGEIRERFPEYAAIGVGRDDGRTGGEHITILYRHDRFAVDQAGTFWLSDTPDRPGSASWGNSITRTCTWARLVELDSGHAFFVYNTHLDHVSQPSRERSTAMIGERLEDRTPQDPAIVMGDFNADEANPAVRSLLDAGGPALTDTFRAVHPEAGDVGTFHAFSGDRSGGKIDHVLVTPGARVIDAAIDRGHDGGRYPSDHFPVTATVDLPGRPG